MLHDQGGVLQTPPTPLPAIVATPVGFAGQGVTIRISGGRRPARGITGCTRPGMTRAAGGRPRARDRCRHAHVAFGTLVAHLQPPLAWHLRRSVGTATARCGDCKSMRSVLTERSGTPELLAQSRAGSSVDSLRAKSRNGEVEVGTTGAGHESRRITGAQRLWLRRVRGPVSGLDVPERGTGHDRGGSATKQARYSVAT